MSANNFGTSTRLENNSLGMKVTSKGTVVLAMAYGKFVAGEFDPSDLRKLAQKMVEMADQAESQQKAGRN
jgi:hypothetical protein